VLRHLLRAAIFLIPIANGGSVARALDFTVANFSSSALLLSEVRDGHDEGVRRIDAGHPYSRKTLAGAVWRVRRAEDGRELCRLVTCVAYPAGATPNHCRCRWCGARQTQTDAQQI
jgi:hypothetical protein